MKMIHLDSRKVCRPITMSYCGITCKKSVKAWRKRMNTVQYIKGITFESNTIYKGVEKKYDFYLDDVQEILDEDVFVDANVKNKKARVAFYICGIENTVIDFQGATLVFHGRIVPFILKNCKNVKLINFKVDYDRPFYTQADVISVSPTEMEVKICKGFDYRIENGYLYVHGAGWEKNLNRDDCLLWMYDKTKNKNYEIILGLFGEEVYPSENPPLPIQQLKIEEKRESLIIKGEFPKSWDTNGGNNVLLITHELRDKAIITLLNCEDTFIKDVTVIYGASMALIAMNSRNIEIERFDFRQNYNGNGRYVSNNADGIHTYNCGGKIVIRNCYMEGLLDDYINIHNNYLLVESVQENKVCVKSPGAAIGIQCPVIAKGQEIVAYNQRTIEEKDRFQIKNLEVDREKQVYLLNLDKIPESLEAGDVLENISSQPEILIQNCYFGNIRGLMHLQSRGKTILENCIFDNPDIALIFTGDMTYWFESGPVRDFTIRNCQFNCVGEFPRFDFRCEVGFTEKEKYYHKNIIIENCKFNRCYGEEKTVAILRYVDDFTFKNNESDGKLQIKAINCGRIDTDCKIIKE